MITDKEFSIEMTKATTEKPAQANARMRALLKKIKEAAIQSVSPWHYRQAVLVFYSINLGNRKAKCLRDELAKELLRASLGDYIRSASELESVIKMIRSDKPVGAQKGISRRLYNLEASVGETRMAAVEIMKLHRHAKKIIAHNFAHSP